MEELKEQKNIIKDNDNWVLLIENEDNISSAIRERFYKQDELISLLVDLDDELLI